MHPALVKALFWSTPFLALGLAEAMPETPSGLVTYGPLGLMCAWLMWRDDRRAKEQDRNMKTLTGEMAKIAHKFNGLTRALTLNAAMHGDDQIRMVANEEIARMQQADEESKS